MIRRAIAVAVCAVLVAAAPMAAAALRLGGAWLGVFEQAVALPIEPATVEVKPESLELRSRGEPVTAIIEAPAGGFDVRHVLAPSIRLCVGGPLCDSGAAPAAKPKVGDADGDGIPDLKVTFGRADVLALVAGVRAPATVTFSLSAVLDDGSACAGTAGVRLVDPGAASGAGPAAPRGSSASSQTAEPSPSVEAPTAEPAASHSETPPGTPPATPMAGSPTPEPVAPDPTDSPIASEQSTSEPTEGPSLAPSVTPTTDPQPTGPPSAVPPPEASSSPTEPAAPPSPPVPAD